MKKIVVVNRGGMPSEELLALLKVFFPECEITRAFILEGEVEPKASRSRVKRRRGRRTNRDGRSPSKCSVH